MNTDTSLMFGSVLKGPEHIGIDITNKCNMRCRHCYNRSSVDSGWTRDCELSNAELISFAEELKELEPPSFCFCGGEPFIRYDVVRRMMLAMRNPLTKPGVVTNGYLVTYEHLKDLADLGLYTIQVSVDGATASTHERLRGVPGGYSKAIDAIRAGTKANIPSRAVAFSPTSFNISEFTDFVGQMSALGVSSVRVQPLMNLGNAQSNMEILPNEDDYARLFEQIEDCRSKYKKMQIEWGDPIDHLLRCSGLMSGFVPHVTIQSNGDIVLSLYLPIAIGNILRHSIKEYWDAGIWRVWGIGFFKEIAECYTSVGALAQDAIPLPRVFHVPNIRLDLIDDHLLDLSDAEMKKLFWSRLDISMVNVGLDIGSLCAENISDVVDLSDYLQKLRSLGCTNNVISMVAARNFPEYRLVQIKSSVEGFVRPDCSTNMVIAEPQLQIVIEYIHEFSCGGDERIEIFSPGMDFRDFTLWMLRARMFYRKHLFVVHYSGKEKLPNVMTCVSCFKNAVDSRDEIRFEMMLVRDKVSISKETYLEHLSYVVNRAVLRFSPLRVVFMIPFAILGENRALKDAIEECGFVHVGRFDGITTDDISVFSYAVT